MKERDEVLDSIRGFCAFLVLAAHARSMVFVDLKSLPGPGIATKGFYFVTGIHFEAVVVFFVLSGYFVGGAVLAAVRKDLFSWRSYALARLTRLWVVLLPALVLTLVCDQIGIGSAPEAYTGEWFETWASGPSTGKPADFGIGSFLGSLLFVQTIETSVFGTNSPLWSLAYEFWYYVLFPLAVMAVYHSRRRELSGALVCFLVFSFLIVWLPEDLLRNAWIWMMGVIVAMIRGKTRRPTFDRVPALVVVAVTGLPVAAALVSAKLIDHWITDFFVGAGFALWMVFLPARANALRWLEPIGRFLSTISYTLYLSHFPLLILLGAVFLKGRQFQATVEGFAIYTALLLVALVVATLLWWLFESRTEAVRRAFSGRR